MQQRPTLGPPSISRDANFLKVLPTVFQECWRRETSYDPEKWSPENPTHGQCAITALVIQDLLGGDLLKGKVNGADHYWNRLPDSSEFDLTRDQFGAAVSVTSPRKYPANMCSHSKTPFVDINNCQAYQGQAAYGKTHMMPRGKKSRQRATRGRPAEPRRSKAPAPTDQKEWVLVPVPAVVDEALFCAAHAQLAENRSRARQGRRRPGYLLQGLTCCAKCGYAYYVKRSDKWGLAVK
jgi:hypothetical protein